MSRRPPQFEILLSKEIRSPDGQTTERSRSFLLNQIKLIWTSPVFAPSRPSRSAKRSSWTSSTSSPITSSSPVTQYKLTVGANQGGWVSFGETSLRRRTAFYIFRPAGTEVTVSAEPADGYVFSGWSNGWTANPITFKLTSNIGFSAEFKTTND